MVRRLQIVELGGACSIRLGVNALVHPKELRRLGGGKDQDCFAMFLKLWEGVSSRNSKMLGIPRTEKLYDTKPVSSVVGSRDKQIRTGS